MEQSVRQSDKHTNRDTNLLSVVVGLENVADGSAVTSPTGRLQNETEEPLVVLMGGTVDHTGERELEDRGGQTRG